MQLRNLVSLSFLSLGLCAPALASVGDSPSPMASLRTTETLATPVLGATLDTLPQGRHQVSSFRNGKSTEFTVEDGKITSLKIDGREIPSDEYDEYEGMVENMLGGGHGHGGGGGDFLFFDVFDNLEDRELQQKRIEEYFERHGEEWERMGERLAERFENMFQFDEEGGVYHFEFDGADSFEFNIDSIMQGHSLRFYDNQREYDLEDLLREKEDNVRSAEEEIEELETMIERMERRKAEAQREIDRRDNPKDEGYYYNGFDIKGELINLRERGQLDPGIIRSFTLTKKYLKVNGKKVAPEVHSTFLKAFKNANTHSNVQIEMSGLSW